MSKIGRSTMCDSVGQPALTPNQRPLASNIRGQWKYFGSQSGSERYKRPQPLHSGAQINLLEGWDRQSIRTKCSADQSLGIPTFRESG